MADLENNIPTLTNVVHKGDENMLNHFDAHQFNAKEDNSNEPAHTIENATEFENTELNEIPSIKIEENIADELQQQDFSEAMSSIKDNTNETALDNEALKEKINQAINDAMPAIESQLKEQLYKKFDIPE